MGTFHQVADYAVRLFLWSLTVFEQGKPAEASWMAIQSILIQKRNSIKVI